MLFYTILCQLPLSLGADNSLLPSSSQELADIFGTSDDEDDVDFPFSLTSNLHIPKGYDDISLSAGDTKTFGNSLLSNDDSGLFLNNCQQSSVNKGGDGINGRLPETVNGPPVTQTIGASKDDVCVKQDTDSKELESLSASEGQGSNPKSDGKGNLSVNNLDFCSILHESEFLCSSGWVYLLC